MRPNDYKESLKYSFKHGKVRGESTGIVDLDPHFSWKRGECTLVAGRPGHGKTEITLFMFLLKSIIDGSKWAVFSPENMTVDNKDHLTPSDLIDQLAHAYIGKNVDPFFSNQMSVLEYEKALDFINEHFFFVYPDEDHTPENINRMFSYCKLEYKIFGCLKDPWNQLDYDDSGGEYQFLRRALKDENKFAKKSKLVNVITVHPSGKPNIDDNGIIKGTTEYDIAGGTMWANKMDNILTINRPQAKLDQKNPMVEFGSHKIKKHKLVGVPGLIELQFDKKTNRYLSIQGNDYINRLTKPKQSNIELINNFEEQAPF